MFCLSGSSFESYLKSVVGQDTELLKPFWHCAVYRNKKMPVSLIPSKLAPKRDCSPERFSTAL